MPFSSLHGIRNGVPQNAIGMIILSDKKIWDIFFSSKVNMSFQVIETDPEGPGERLRQLLQGKVG